jgi:succinylglutamate desuccinylase
VAGLHGNETAGIEAARRVVAALTAGKTEFRGDFSVLRGNVSALACGRRFVDHDLNRMWTPDQVTSILQNGPENLRHTESRELFELSTAVEQILQRARGDCLIFDLHSASSVSAPFTLEGHLLLDESKNQILDVPSIIDTAGFFSGTFMSYYRNQGHLASIFEAGQHQAEETIRLHETAIWAILLGFGLLQRSGLPDPAASLDLYHNGSPRLPASLELFHRHAVLPEDDFQMLPGFKNFDPVKQGQQMGVDKSGPVYSPNDGRVFLPLYQPEGEDGFFLVRDIPDLNLN